MGKPKFIAEILYLLSISLRSYFDSVVCGGDVSSVTFEAVSDSRAAAFISRRRFIASKSGSSGSRPDSLSRLSAIERSRFAGLGAVIAQAVSRQ